MLEPPFDIIEPSEGDSPVLVEIPHAGLAFDAESLEWTVAPGRCFARDADLYVDELFADAPELGATLLCARMSRYVVDLNRAETHHDAEAVAGSQRHTKHPRGVIWRLSSDNMPVLREPLSVSEYERRCACYYRPYHDVIARVLNRKRERFGLAVLLCAHSMPEPHRRSGALPTVSPDLIPGTRGRTSAATQWIDLVDEAGRARGWTVQHDVPYRGGFSTGHYGRPANNVHAVQIELARRLYMDEKSLARRSAGFAVVKDFARDLVAKLVAEAKQVYCAPTS